MYLKVIIVSLLILVVGTLVGFLAFPMLLEHLIRRQINLKEGSDTRQIWEKMPFPMSFKVFVFNVTNAVDIEDGEMPELQEVGPFVFEEWKDKYNIEDNEAEDTVSFNMRNTFKLRSDLGLSGEELITMPQPLLQFMAISVQNQQPDMLTATAVGLDVIFKPTSAFITAPFMDLFYRGIDVDCAQEQPAAQAICQTFYKGDVHGAVQQNATHFKFSFMGAGNHSNAGRFTVSRGSGNRHSSTVGQVLLFNEQDKLQVWSEGLGNSSCNQFRGTDGTVFAPYMRRQEGLWSYSPQLCRSLSPHMVGKVNYNLLPAYRYELDFGDASLDTDSNCFCKAYPFDCPVAGTVDLSRCTGTPMVASLPHFYKADMQLVHQVKGLSPSAQKHSSVIIFERLSGTVLSVYNRLQFSLNVEPVSAIPVMSKLRNLTMPLFWIEESMQLNKDFTNTLQKQLFSPIKFNNVFRWLAIALGTLGFAMGALLLHLRRNDVKRVAHSIEGASVEDDKN
ncbi:sensory neuron membrane protein 1-like [Scaptodrosophila lebanonensis]|uniref:Sensory neuron membrane protein 1 n=1 Tax=Drosophila lebanonensis TaxID=7225 RepID=A0A6J2UJH4_DROLE|nr:sensory neuron membrane protein 1-like [Scaptodrosophila lebanonensis]